jgi:uncharacterized protein YbjQ (UPF0145 family)
VKHNMTATEFTLDGYRIVESKGVVRGVIVRSLSIVGSIGAGLQTLVGRIKEKPCDPQSRAVGLLDSQNEPLV